MFNGKKTIPQVTNGSAAEPHCWASALPLVFRAPLGGPRAGLARRWHGGRGCGVAEGTPTVTAPATSEPPYLGRQQDPRGLRPGARAHLTGSGEWLPLHSGQTPPGTEPDAWVLLLPSFAGFWLGGDGKATGRTHLHTQALSPGVCPAALLLSSLGSQQGWAVVSLGRSAPGRQSKDPQVPAPGTSVPTSPCHIWHEAHRPQSPRG